MSETPCNVGNLARFIEVNWRPPCDHSLSGTAIGQKWSLSAATRLE